LRIDSQHIIGERTGVGEEGKDSGASVKEKIQRLREALSACRGKGVTL